MTKRNLLLVLIISLLLVAGCAEEEVYNPIKKTGYDAPPIEIDIPHENGEVNSEEEIFVEEEHEEVFVEEEIVVEEPFHNFEDRETFTVTAEELLVRINPNFDSQIILYLYENDEVEVVDKVTDFEGTEWYTLRLLDYDLYYGFAVAEYLERIE